MEQTGPTVARCRAASKSGRNGEILCLPGPPVPLNGQFVRCCVALTVEEAGDVLAARFVATDDLGTAHIEVTDAAISGVQDE